MIAVIDNYDSFTYNLVQYLGELGAPIEVFRNDRLTVDELAATNPSHLVISPGPGNPQDDAGVSNDAIRHFHGRIPILGVCLGHQCIAHVFGGRVTSAPRLMHGKVSRIRHEGGALFAGVPSTFDATRYHSLIVERPLPDDLVVAASTAEGEIMALQHRRAPTWGLQFHPESILTPSGKRILANFLHLTVDAPLASAADPAGELAAIDLPEAIARALNLEHLTAPEAEAVMTSIMSGGATPAQIGAYLAALRVKGETVAEITGFARAMRRRVTPVHPARRPLVDTCGTGGDGAHTFNVSTTAALVVAGAGVAVAKHGNRSVSSRCGSADVLQALGVRLDLPPERVAGCIDSIGFGFLFAPELHPAMRHAIGPRREIKVRTVFNLLGPLTNPAGASVQLMGVYDAAWVEPLAHVLNELGAQEAFVVNSSDGLDELSAAGPNRVAHVAHGRVSCMTIDAADYGLPRIPARAIAGDDAQENARITRAVLAGERSPYRDVAVLNAGMALVAAGAADELRAGMALAAESIDRGSAARVLEQLVAFTREEAA